MRSRRWTAWATLFALACSPPSEVEAPEADPPEAPVAAQPPVRHARPTTDGEQARRSLDARITGLRKGLDRDPSARAALLEALRLRATLFGKVSDLDIQLRLADAGEPSVRARARLALHRFDEALSLDPTVAPSVELARHQGLDALEAERRAAVDARPSATAWSALGDVLLAAGRPADADAAYAEALAAYRDVSPLFVADLQFRRGFAWGETGPEDERDPARARALYEDAVRVLPGFVRAQVHLAELEWQAGEHAAAIARVRRVVDAEDPEPSGKLAVWLEGEEAARHREQTIQRYEALLARHPLAFADHGAEFFAAIGDVDRARELAAQDLTNRSTPRSRGRCEELGCL
jgi:tetratricopeptide (TPR) repeat protein